MTDVHTKETRSYNMSKIRAKNTKPELVVRKFLFQNGFRYRLHYSKLPGKPDIALVGRQVVINIHGCFWHGHENCKYYKLPKTRTEWWNKKIRDTKKRDITNSDKLFQLGWSEIVIWECELLPNRIESTLNGLIKKLNGDQRN